MKKFETPVMNIVRCTVVDVITTSQGGGQPTQPTKPGGNNTSWG